ncbi:hypothetical protein TWF481_007520 [Arthrobotrys musiformis]|uniref:Uncharacterized protein n=1 Tax=Arthrobotrys musiformis TaxID=47236 RepID=A0AAV9WCK3_9PEZI
MKFNPTNQSSALITRLGTLLLTSIFFSQIYISPTAAVAIASADDVKYSLVRRTRGGFVFVDKDAYYNEPYISRKCRLSLYHIDDSNDWANAPGANWNDRPVPIEAITFPYNWGDGSTLTWGDADQQAQSTATCYNAVRNIDSRFAGTAGITHVYVSGWCFCEFFSSEDCPNEDGRKRRGNVSYQWVGYASQNVRVELINGLAAKTRALRCVQGIMPHIDRIPTVCEITLGNGGDQNKAYNAFDGGGDGFQISKTYTCGLQEGEINQYSGLGPCERISDDQAFRGKDGVRMRSWSISGCTCQFWTNDKCEGSSLIRDGHGESVRRDVSLRRKGYYGAFDYQVIRSFRCERPWGRPCTGCNEGL